MKWFCLSTSTLATHPLQKCLKMYETGQLKKKPHKILLLYTMNTVLASLNYFTARFKNEMTIVFQVDLDKHIKHHFRLFLAFKSIWASETSVAVLRISIQFKFIVYAYN